MPSDRAMTPTPPAKTAPIGPSWSAAGRCSLIHPPPLPPVEAETAPSPGDAAGDADALAMARLAVARVSISSCRRPRAENKVCVSVFLN